MRIIEESPDYSERKSQVTSICNKTNLNLGYMIAFDKLDIFFELTSYLTASQNAIGLCLMGM